ncbi:MAG: cation transporter [Motiliproteus sp.]
MAESSVRVVKVALISNCSVTLFKLITGVLTGSAALIGEALHSFMDATNQAVLYRNAHSRGQASEHIYSYGHGQTRYLVNLWASVGLFSIGAGMGFAWGIYRLIAAYLGEGLAAQPQVAPTVTDWMSLLAVLGALMIQGYSFTLAARLYINRMLQDQVRNPLTYLRDCKDVSLAIIVAESIAGLGGLLLAGLGILITLVAHNPFWDALAALLIAVLIGGVAFQLGYIYMRYLTDVRNLDAERALKQILTKRQAVHSSEQIHSVILDDNSTILFAEIELDQEAMVTGMLKSISTQKKELLRKLPADKQADIKAIAFVTARAMVEAPLKRAGLIVANLEQSLREEVPQVTAVSIRIKGISPFKLPEPKQRKPLPTQEAEYMGPEK